MNKRLLIIAGGGGFLLVLGVVIFFRYRKAPSLLSPVVNPIEKEKEGIKLATWEDPAGFSFSYPEDIEIDPHEEDQENYAHLELTASDHSGGIVIWIKDTAYTKIEDWVEEEATGSSQVFDTQLGGESAKKVTFGEPKKLVTAAIDVDVLVLLEMTPDEGGYWQEAYDQILSSFAFISLEGEEPGAPGQWEGAGGAGGIIEESEEVIE